jgi:hypothetical protein
MKKIKLTRPVAILYYSQARGGLPTAQGAVKNTRNSKARSAAMVFADERYQRAEIVDRGTGCFMLVLSRTTDGKINVNTDKAGEVCDNYQWRAKLDAKNKAARAKKGRK